MLYMTTYGVRVTFHDTRVPIIRVNSLLWEQWEIRSERRNKDRDIRDYSPKLPKRCPNSGPTWSPSGQPLPSTYQRYVSADLKRASSENYQTRGVGPMSGWRWTIVVEAGPTSAQHWANASYLLGSNLQNFLDLYSCVRTNDSNCSLLKPFGSARISIIDGAVKKRCCHPLNPRNRHKKWHPVHLYSRRKNWHSLNPVAVVHIMYTYWHAQWQSIV